MVELMQVQGLGGLDGWAGEGVQVAGSAIIGLDCGLGQGDYGRCEYGLCGIGALVS